MKKLLVFILILPLMLTNCDGCDKCKKKDCGEYGTCNDGNCDCPEGVSELNGRKCSLEDREKFIKTFYTTTTFCNGGTFPQGTPLSCSRTGDNNDIILYFGGSNTLFELKGNVIGNNISISSQTYDGDEYSGNGNLSSNGNLLLLTITRRRAGSTDCVFNISGT